MRIINVDLIKHPLNWVIILLMLIIAGAFGHYFLSFLGVEPQTSSSYGKVSPGLAPGSVAQAIPPQAVVNDPSEMGASYS